MTTYTEESLYAMSLSELIQLCTKRQVTPLSSNPRWKKTYVPALLTAQEESTKAPLKAPEEVNPEVLAAPVKSELPESLVSAAEDSSLPLPPSPWEEAGQPEQTSEKEKGASTLSPAAAVYPIVFVMLIVWIAMQVSVGVMSLVVAGLRFVARKLDEQATRRLELLRVSESAAALANIPLLECT